VDATFVKELTARASELGVRFDNPEVLLNLLEGDQTTTTLLRGDSSGEFRVVYSPALTVSAIGADTFSQDNQRLLLVGPRVTERSAEQFRRMSVSYLDQAGNAHIVFPGVYIDVRGRKSTHLPTPTHTHRGGTNLFSEKRAQVIFAILEWPELLQDRLRVLASTAGVSIGQAQSTLGLLEELGFLDSSRRIIPQRREALTDQWVSAYQTGLRTTWSMDSFAADTIDFEDCGHTIFLSGESAVPHQIRAETTVIYASELPKNMIRRYRWRRNHEQPNIYLRKKFWSTPWLPETPGIYKAPKLLIYADLLASGNSRQREVATTMRDEL
jgi:hypothetical protein